MEFWIAIFGGTAVLVAQWALISLVALGSLRRRVQAALRELDGPMRHYLEDAATAVETARGFGTEVQVLRRQREAREQLEVFLGALASGPMEQLDLEEFRKAWSNCLRSNQAVNHAVLGLPCVVEGWVGQQGDLETRSNRVSKALDDYNRAVQEYEYRWHKGATSLAARWFGYGRLEEWPTEEVSTQQGW